MPFRSVLLLFTTLLFTIACSSTKTFSPSATDRAKTIDGQLSDWNTGSSLIESSDQINYYASRDENYLYLFVDVRSQFMDNAIRQSGLIVYLSNSEEERKRIGIAYPAGTFNLLRENPARYRSFLNDPEWMQNTSNRETLTALSEELFTRVMIVERNEDNETQHGFVESTQLEVDGLEVAVDEERRYIGIEMKIPLDGGSVYGITDRKMWLGFEIETPNFRIRDESSQSVTRDNYRGGYGNQQRRPTASDQRRNISRSLGEYEKWYILDL